MCHNHAGTVTSPSWIAVTKMQHKSDFIRLEQLIEHGGIYLDLDAIPLKSFDKLRRSGFDCIVARQANLDVGVGLLVTKKNTTMMRDFLQKALQGFDGSWAGHSVGLLTQLIYNPAYADDVLSLDQHAFFPLSYGICFN